MSKVYAVHCVDIVEPPCQDFDVLYKMINEMFGLSIGGTEEDA